MPEIFKNRVPSSFRDPSGFLFRQKGVLFRQINKVYQEHYEHLMKSGLYEKLVLNKLMIAHEETNIDGDDRCYKVIQPQIVPFISYPYEWSFSMLKDAALATLEIEKTALEYGMTLKDSSAYNIQFSLAKPILIDTLSFEKYSQGEPWKAYRQFCQHFLAPLALMSYKDVRLNQLLRIYIDGIPLDLACALLPVKTRFSFSLLSHIHLHAATQKKYSEKTVNTSHKKLSHTGRLAIIDNLESAIKKLQWQPRDTEWGEYYGNTNYSDTAFTEKRKFVSAYLDQIRPKSVWDLGANTGIFSRLASERGINTVAFDIDPAAVEKNYLTLKNDQETSMLPLVLDLTNPSPAIGWANEERMAFGAQGPVDMIFALALIHHLAISNNVPLSRIAAFFQEHCRMLVIEFVPKNDSQVQRLLATREDVFPDYTQEGFEREFGQFFLIERVLPIADSQRMLYLMKGK